MKEFNAEAAQVETASALKAVQEAGKERYAVYVGLDVHKETIAVAPGDRPSRTGRAGVSRGGRPHPQGGG